MIKFLFAVTVIVLAAAALALPPQADRSFLLITIDTLRADRLSSAGYSRTISPNLDAFIAQGVHFKRAFSTAPETAPAHASMLTGLLPSFHTLGRSNGNFVLDEHTITLAELCTGHGLVTEAVISNPVLVRDLGLAQGFDTYDDDLKGQELNRHSAEQYAPEALQKALAVLERVQNRPFCVWLHFQDPHGPYNPPEGWLEKVRATAMPAAPSKSLSVGKDETGYHAIPKYQVFGNERLVSQYRDRYDAEVAYLDQHLGILFEHIAKLGLLDRTLIAVTSDHGESMGEDGYFFAHGHSIGRELVEVPLVFAGGGVSSGVAITAPVSTLDIFATALEYLRIDTPPGTQSLSLLPVLVGSEDRLDPRPVYVEGNREVGLARGMNYVRRLRSRGGSPGGTAGGKSMPLAMRTKFELTLDRFIRETDLAQSRLSPRRHKRFKTEDQIEALRSLGYVE